MLPPDPSERNAAQDERNARQAKREATQALEALGHFAEVLLPQDAVEPILAPALQEVLHAWLVEIRLAADLQKVKCKPRSTALLYGPPGTGKTTMAWHIAARLGMPLANVKSESIMGKYLGEAEKNMAALFDAMAKCRGQIVVLFDEVDSIGGKRDGQSSTGGGAHEARISTLNVMLRKIERFNGICLAATNRKDALDSALWRRFGMQIEVGLPGDEERFAIIKRYLDPYDMPDDDVDTIVEMTEGTSPALLQQLMEGVKRQLVVGPKLGQCIDNPCDVFDRIVRSVTPPPEYKMTPPLWQGGGVEGLSAISWPPRLKGAA